MKIIFNLLSDESVRQNLLLGREGSLVTNEELITPSSLSSLKSCTEVCVQKEVPDCSISNKGILKKEENSLLPITKENNDNEVHIGYV